MHEHTSPFHDPRPALEVFTQPQLLGLWQYLNNGNADDRYVLGILDREGKPGYFRQKRLTVERGISWAFATVRGKQPPGKRVAFVPYSYNDQHESVWGAFDFDAHNDEWERARSFAEKATAALHGYNFSIIAEQSGGGYHVWAIATEPKPVSTWRTLLERLALDIGAPIGSGVCEVFPPLPKRADSLGKGMRVPGSWHPTRDDFSKIVALFNCELLFQSLSGKSSDASSNAFPKVKEIYSFSSSSISHRAEGRQPLGNLPQFAITQNGQRHGQLEKLTGHVFYQLGYAVARKVAEQQYRQKSAVTNASEIENLAEFDNLWSGLAGGFKAGLNDGERVACDLLTTDTERDAFRIFKSYARLAATSGKFDFPIVCANLADRLEITPQGAGLLRKKFCRAEIGILEMTAPALPNVAAARYRWLLLD